MRPDREELDQHARFVITGPPCRCVADAWPRRGHEFDWAWGGLEFTGWRKAAKSRSESIKFVAGSHGLTRRPGPGAFYPLVNEIDMERVGYRFAEL